MPAMAARPQPWANVHGAAAALPAIDELLRRCRAIAMLDAIVCPEKYYRYYHFATAGTGNQVASMNNGSGDHFEVTFCGAGAFIHGFDHESDMSPWVNDDNTLWPGVLDTVPDVFAAELTHPFLTGGDFDPPSVTFCLWRQPADDRWSTGDITFPPLFGTRTDPDGAGLLRILGDDGPDAYIDWATGYYQRSSTRMDRTGVAAVYAHRPLDQPTVDALAPGRTVDDLIPDATGIGFPVSATTDRSR